MTRMLLHILFMSQKNGISVLWQKDVFSTGKKLILENSRKKIHLERVMTIWFCFLPSFDKAVIPLEKMRRLRKLKSASHKYMMVFNKYLMGSKGIVMCYLWSFQNYFCKSKDRPTNGQLSKTSHHCNILLSITHLSSVSVVGMGEEEISRQSTFFIMVIRKRNLSVAVKL